MWKFKTTKYKNSAPKIPKKEEWITNLPIGNLMQSAGNHIGASCTFMAFNTGAGCLGILPIGASGRQNHVPILYGHSDFLSDFQFCPVNDGLLATGSFDCTVKIWSLGDSVTENLSNAACSLSHIQHRVENVVWNPVVEGILAVVNGPCVDVFDVECNKKLFTLDDHGDQVQGFTWKQDGCLTATTCKDKKIRLFDPRAAQPKIQEGNGHANFKDSRVTWLGTSDMLLSTGFTQSRSREVRIWDSKNLDSSLSIKDIDSGTSVLVPLYDPDSRMIFLAAKGDTSLRFCEITDNSPYITDGACDNLMQMMGTCLIPKRSVDVMKGEVNRVLLLCKDKVVPCPYIVPRKNYREFHADIFPDTFSGEAAMTAKEWINGENKPFTMCSLNPAEAAGKIKPSKPFMSAAAPTTGPVSASTIENGSGAVSEPQKPLVAPIKHEPTESPAQTPSQVPHNIKDRIGKAEHLFDGVEHDSASVSDTQPIQFPHVKDKIGRAEHLFDGHSRESAKPKPPLTVDVTQTSDVDPNVPLKVSTLTIGSPEANKQQSFGRLRSFSTEEEPTLSSPPGTEVANGEKPHHQIKVVTHDAPVARREKKRPVFKGVRVSKCRHLKGTPLHKSNNIENIRNLSNSMPGECDLFHVNRKRFAVPLKGAGGLVGVYELSKPGRLPDMGVPHIQNGSKVYDFTWDPFDPCRLATCCEDGAIRVWQIPEEGLVESLTNPSITLRGHDDRLYFTRFHPLAKDVLTSASHDMQIIVWNLDSAIPQITCTGHTDVIFCLSWSQDGTKFATVCKDGKIRIYAPRESPEPVLEGPGPDGVRGARIVWALNDTYLVVTGFDRQSHRLLLVYDAGDLSAAITTEFLDVSPSILIPFYDEDTSTLFVTGRGDGTVFAFEVSEEHPHLFALSNYRADGLHQAFSFLPKSEMDVRQIEFAKAYKLTHTTAEPVSFTIPRVKKEYFQDDIFPPTKVTWEPSMSASEWFSGTNKPAKRISLKPSDMEMLNKAPVEVPRVSKFESYNPETFKTDSEKKEELIGAMMSKLDDHTDKPLPQDLAEGVDEDEWDD